MWILTTNPEKVKSIMEAHGHSMDWPSTTFNTSKGTLMLILADDQTSGIIAAMDEVLSVWHNYADVPEDIAGPVEPVVESGRIPERREGCEAGEQPSVGS